MCIVIHHMGSEELFEVYDSQNMNPDINSYRTSDSNRCDTGVSTSIGLNHRYRSPRSYLMNLFLPVHGVKYYAENIS